MPPLPGRPAMTGDARATPERLERRGSSREETRRSAWPTHAPHWQAHRTARAPHPGLVGMLLAVVVPTASVSDRHGAHDATDRRMPGAEAR